MDGWMDRRTDRGIAIAPYTFGGGHSKRKKGKAVGPDGLYRIVYKYNYTCIISPAGRARYF